MSARRRGAGGRSAGRLRAPFDAGSSLPELLVAASLIMVALSLLGSFLLPSIGALGSVAEVDPVAHELDIAAETIVRLVRAARGGPGDPAVSSVPDGVALRLPVEGGDVTVTVVVVDGSVSLSGGPTGDLTWDEVIARPGGVLVAGVDAGTEVDGLQGEPEGPVVAVRVRLIADEREVLRLVRIEGSR